MTEPEYDYDDPRFLLEAERLDAERRKRERSQPSSGHAKKRRREVEPAIKRHELEKRNRDAALATPIPETSIGHRLLAKMGYAGGSLGPEERNGIVEPLKPQIRAKRLGLQTSNREEAPPHVKVAREPESHAESTALAAQFRARHAAKFDEKHYQAQLDKALEACLSLDMRDARTPSLFADQAPSVVRERERQAAAAAQLALAVRGQSAHADSSSDAEPPSSAALPSEDESAAPTLEAALMYLRDEYRYCLYCGFAYDSAKQLSDECPGLFEESHEEL